ncbi:hypothetical protein D9K80_16055 [Acinetobacter cumulans]|jgi:predicted transcriptional regulator|uniref:Uncharacterized protein n=1 Tax=Acinetobacter cumulans TaxID=2136182 RepID=A0A498CT58_9GAMM|nr:hypothetical protein [Acinetobacter cumulans]RLL30518.1 hypothetical protein D9K80_16055 [Acinetobacter cumulans]
MRSSAEHELLQAIFNEMQELKKAIQIKDERRVNVREFAQRMNVTPATLYNRIKEGLIREPHKDGKLSYWLNSYVNSIITQSLNSDKVAA